MSQFSLTQAQAELLAFIQGYQDENDGVSPSFEEMKEALGLASKSGVHRMIQALVERGRLARMENRARCLMVLDEPPPRPPLEAYTSAELVAELARRSGANRRAA